MALSTIRAALAAAVTSALLLSAALAGPVAAAGTVTVSVGCPGGNGNTGKLVQAVRDANTRAPKKTIINLAAICTYSFFRANSFPVDGVRANALPVVRSHITIHGHGSTVAHRDGAARFRFVAVDVGGGLTIDNLTVTDFRARHGRSGASHLGTPGDNGEDGRDGGAIYNLGSVILSEVTLDDNQAGNGGNGGASTGFDALNGSPGHDGADGGPKTTGGNAGAGGRGGAIYSEGSLTITDSTLSNNRAGNGGKGGDAAAGAGGSGGPGNPGGSGGTGAPAAGGNGGPGGYGGAIYSAGPLSISSSTISANWTGHGGDSGDASGGRGGNGADTTGTGGTGGSAVALAASAGTGMAIYQWGGHADVLNDNVTNNSGADGGSSRVTEGDGGDGGCDGTGGIAGGAVAGIGNGGVDALRADNGATLTTTGTTESGTTTGIAGAGVIVPGSAGSNGAACPV